MDGWILINNKGQYLTKARTWKTQRESEGEVFSDSEIAKIRVEALAWEVSPETMIPAREESGRVSLRNGMARGFWKVRA